MRHQPLLDDIEAHIAKTGMSAHKFGMLAVKNGRLVERLRAGRRVWPETEIAIRAYLRSSQTASESAA